MSFKYTVSIIALIVACVVAAIFLEKPRELTRRVLVSHKPFTYQGQFHKAIRDADRIVVRAGGFDCCGKVDNDRIFFTITNTAELLQVATNLQFAPFTLTNSIDWSCMCCGHPGIDWYQGNRRLALTSVQHGEGLRWNGFTTVRIAGMIKVGYGDAPLTSESSKWLVDWLASHGVSGPKKEMEKSQRGKNEEKTNSPAVNTKASNTR